MEDRAADDLVRVESILRGDRDAFADLVRRYQSLVAGVAWRYGIRRDDIEDVVSEVMIKVYRNLSLYRPDYPFSTWLYRLAANHVLDHARRARREHGRTEMPPEIADDSPGPADGMEGRERAALVRAALAEIDTRYREVIFLVYVEGRKVDEVARTLGIPEGTVKTRLLRGRDALRRVLVRRHPEHFGD
jgi:RNA polymerase sigma-70 factor (ECF subfamily)